MDIIIPTHGRHNNQETLKQLLNAELGVHIVIQDSEERHWDRTAYGLPVKIHVLPSYIKTIAPTRQWILDNVGDSNRFVMLDDDLTFFKRRDDARDKLRDITPEELHGAFDLMEDMLGNYAHVGFASREGANRNTETYSMNTRIMRVLGYQRDVLKSCGIRFDDMEVMEDFHVALQLLKRGLPNVILNNYAHNQGGSGSAGGCSHFRTPELHSANANRLAFFHAPFVKVVQKTTKGSFGGGTRDDVLVYWKKAYASGGGK